MSKIYVITCPVGYHPASAPEEESLLKRVEGAFTEEAHADRLQRILTAAGSPVKKEVLMVDEFQGEMIDHYCPFEVHVLRKGNVVRAEKSSTTYYTTHPPLHGYTFTGTKKMIVHTWQRNLEEAIAWAKQLRKALLEDGKWQER